MINNIQRNCADRGRRLRRALVNAVVITGLTSQPLFAEIQFGVSGDVRISDNGNRVADGNPKTTEIILQSGANFGADITGNIYNASANYQFAQNTFLENTQQDGSFFTGTSAFRLGNDTNMFNLDLTHSRQLASIQRFAANNFNNLEERDIATVTPSMRLRPSRRDTVLFSVSYSETRFSSPAEVDQDNTGVNRRPNSELLGQNFSWNHILSPISTFGFQANRSESDIEGSEQKFEYEQAQFTYASSLRLLSYSIGAGYNQATFLSESFGSPSFDINGTYESGAHRFQLSFTSFITETSQGNRNRVGVVGESVGGITSPVGRDIADGGIDTFESQTYEASYGYAAIPGRLDVALFLGTESTRFQVNEESNADSLFARFTADYTLTRRSDIAYEYDWWQIKPEGLEGAATKNYAHRVTYNMAVSETLNWSVFASREHWDSTIGALVFTENFLGASINYRVF